MYSRLLAIAFVMLGLSSGVSAQTTPRTYASGVAGVTFGTESDLMFGGEFGGNVTETIQLFGEVGLMRNVLPRHIQDGLDELADILTLTTGDLWEFDATVRNTYFGGGVRVMFPRRELRPYLLGGLGVAALRLKVTELDFGDITDELVEDGDLDNASETKPMVSLGGGIMVPVGGSTFVDLGYRFHKVFTEESVNISRLYGALGFRF